MAEDVRRLAGAAGGRLAPPAASGTLAAAPAVGFLSEEEAVEGAGRRAGAVVAARVAFGRVLGAAATVGLAALAAGCHTGASWCT